MAGAQDKVSAADEAFADVIPGDAASRAPQYPCLEADCGAETKEHHTPPGSRICSAKDCRTVMEGAAIEKSKALGDALQPTVLPCPKCGKPTKEHHTPPGSRICSNKACRTIVARKT